MGWLRKKFLTGLLIILPTVITAYVLYWLFISIDNILKPLFAKYPFLDFPGFGFVSVILVIMLVGVFAGNLIGRRIIGWAEDVVTRIPLIRRMYTAVKQISEVFLKQERTVFSKAILVQYPRPGIYVVGLVTSNWKVCDANGKEQNIINVFLPTTPNPTSGLFLMIPEEDAIPLNCSVDDAMKMVISGGAFIPFIKNLEISNKPEGLQENESP
jgi:uncharacterized membrane protein